MRFIVLVSALVLSSVSAAGEVYQCTHGDLQREIAVNYADETSKLPCEVVYTKAEGQQVLWSASNEVGYCEAKAKAFVAKHEGWGWSCTASETADSQEAPATQ